MYTLINYLEDILKEQNGGFHFWFPQNIPDDIVRRYEEELTHFAVSKNKEDYFFNSWIQEHKEELYNCVYAKRYPLEEFDLMSNFKVYYRGVSNERYNNVPGVYRDIEKHEENYYYNEMQVQCPTSFEKMGQINKLTYMQHYGCPTRLLDITSNPLVGLYFACQGSENDNGAVYIFYELKENVLYEQSDKVQVLSKLAELKKSEQNEILFLSYLNLFKEKFPQHTNGKYGNPIIERFYHMIKKDNPAFERELVPLDILSPYIVQTHKDNPRILKQDGAFIISGLNYDESECAFKINRKIGRTVIIPGKDKKEILKQLAWVGITKASLFPEVDKVAEYLKTNS